MFGTSRGVENASKSERSLRLSRCLAQVDVEYTVGSVRKRRRGVPVGRMPIMLRSKKCAIATPTFAFAVGTKSDTPRAARVTSGSFVSRQCSRARQRTVALIHCLSHTNILISPCSPACSLSQTQTHSRAKASHSPSCLSRHLHPFSPSPSLPHSLLIHSLTHSFMYALTFSLTHSLTYSLTLNCDGPGACCTAAPTLSSRAWASARSTLEATSSSRGRRRRARVCAQRLKQRKGGSELKQREGGASCLALGALCVRTSVTACERRCVRASLRACVAACE
eukprot:2577610-Pleurochrysis_carterae.AAC.1